jgi:hypothetical protein
LQLAEDVRMIPTDDGELGGVEKIEPFPGQTRQKQRSRAVFNPRKPIPPTGVRVDPSGGTEQLRKQNHQLTVSLAAGD